MELTIFHDWSRMLNVNFVFLFRTLVFYAAHIFVCTWSMECPPPAPGPGPQLFALKMVVVVRQVRKVNFIES